jgi:hypothetical protein
VEPLLGLFEPGHLQKNECQEKSTLHRPNKTARKVSDIRVVHLHCRLQSLSLSRLYLAAVLFIKPRLCFARRLSLANPVTFSLAGSYTRASSRLATAKKEYTTLSSALSAPSFDGTRTHSLAPSIRRCLSNDINFFLFLLLLVVLQHPPSALRG